MGNLLKGDSITVTYRYVTEVTFSQTLGVFYIPTFISPRYKGEHVPHPNSHVKATVRINGKVTNLIPETPGLSISLGSDHVAFTFESEGAIERDIEIKFSIEQSTGAHKFTSRGHTFAMVQFMPTINFERTYRNIVFVIDCSGSMDNDRIVNARKAVVHCLQKMVPTDGADTNSGYRFNICCFGSSHRFLYTSMQTATKDSVANAVKLVEGITANMGGTETYNALQAVLKMSDQAILLTDGDTGNNEDMHKLCKEFSSLCMLGIGEGINRTNILDMARNGNGIALFNQGGTNTTSNMDTLLRSVGYPGIREIETNLTGSVPVTQTVSVLETAPVVKNSVLNLSTAYPVIPNHFHTTYALIDAISDQPNFVLKGKTADANILTEIPFTDLPSTYDTNSLGCLVAKRVIQQAGGFESDTDRDALVKIACDFGIVTSHTSFVAVGEKIVVDPSAVPDSTTQTYNSIDQVYYRGSSKGGYAVAAAAACAPARAFGNYAESSMLQTQSMSFYSVDEVQLASAHQFKKSAVRMSSNPLARGINTIGSSLKNASHNLVGAFGFAAGAPAFGGQQQQFSASPASAVAANPFGVDPFSTSVAASAPRKREEKKEESDEDMGFDFYGDSDDSEPTQTFSDPSVPKMTINFAELLDKHFDVSTGLCKPSIVTMIPSIPFNLLNNPMSLTKYVMFLLRVNGTNTEYKQFVAVVKAGGSFSEQDLAPFVTTSPTLTTLKTQVYQECGIWEQF